MDGELFLIKYAIINKIFELKKMINEHLEVKVFFLQRYSFLLFFGREKYQVVETCFV